MKNRYWVVTEPKKVKLIQQELPPLADDQVLVDVQACGICQVEIHAFSGKTDQIDYSQPYPLGHEAVGHVIEKGKDVTYVEIGDRVGAIAGFAFGEKIICNEQQVGKVPTEGDAALFISEPATCVLQFMKNLTFMPGQRVLQFGLGYMGLLNLQCLPDKIMSKVIVVEPRENIHPLARQFGADLCINPLKVDMVQAIGEVCPEGVDIVIDSCGGIRSVFEATPGLLRRGPDGYSQWGIFTSVWEKMSMTLDVNEVQSKGIRIIGSFSRERPMDNRRACQLLSKGTFDQSKLITHRFPFEDVPRAMEATLDRPSDWIKGVICMK